MSCTGRVAVLPALTRGGMAERDALPLRQLTDEVAALAARVDEHLKKMGVVWK